LRLVLLMGINEYPEPGKVVRRETYVEEYEEMVKKDGVPFVPGAISKDLIFSGLLILAILVLAVVVGPKGPLGFPDPTQINTAPRPDFYFLWIFSVMALLPPYMETFLLLVGPVVGVLLLFAVPFISNTGEKSASRRPVAVVSVVALYLFFGLLTYMGIPSAWSPHMDAWSGAPTPVAYIEGRSPVELRGAVVVQSKQCRNCHSLGGLGGERGPALDGVANRLTRDQLIRQVIQGGGNMPAYGKNLSPDEVTALVAFLQTLGDPNVAPARVPTGPEKPAK